MEAMMDSERKFKLIKKLIKDHKVSKINSFAAMIALELIVDPKKPSKECKEWAKDCLKIGRYYNEN
jgi:hypothetical protein